MDRRTFVRGMAATGAALGAASFAAPAFADTPSLRFRDMYSRGKQLTEAAAALQGQRISMTGYMAPPLKPEIDFFVLTKLPMATCPFCNDAQDWPNDIVVSYSAEPLQIVRFSNLIKVEGRFETGFETDPDTGFVSFVRLMDVTYSRV
jgi:hypothetical protein